MNYRMDGMTYSDLSPMERNRLANEMYRKMAFRNITEQSKRLEEDTRDPEYEGKVQDDSSGLDISEQLTIIADSFRFLNNNITRLKDLLTKTPRQLPGHPGYPPDPADYQYGDQDAAFKKDMEDYKAKVRAVEAYEDSLAFTITESKYNNFFEIITKLIYNLETILLSTTDIIQDIKEYGEEEFDFSQFNKVYKLYDKFITEVLNYVAIFYPVTRHGNYNIIQLYIMIKQAKNKLTPGQKEKLEDISQYIENFTNMTDKVVYIYDGLKKISKEKGRRKIQSERLI